MEGHIWKINIVRIRISNKKAETIFWLPPKIKDPEPKVKHMIAQTKMMDMIGSGIPFEDIYLWLFFQKL